MGGRRLLPVRDVPERPSLEYLKKLAKERLRELSVLAHGVTREAHA